MASCPSPERAPAPFSARTPGGTGGVRPSMVRDNANHFADAKIANHNVAIFTNDVLMEGELGKKGEGGLQTWKQRMFVLRGQELSYYTIEGERYGALKGTMSIGGATVERMDGNMFALTLRSGSTRVLAAPTVQALMDWMTAIAIASSATIVQPPSDKALVDHSRTTHIILVRHGQYVTSQTPSQDMNGPLTELGIEQAKLSGAFLVEYLSARMVLKRFPTFPIYHSGTRRTFETAQIMSQSFPQNGFELRENKLFREAWPGNPLPSTNRKMLAREKLDNMVSDCSRVKFVYRTMFRHLIPDDVDLRENALSEEDKQTFARIFGSKTSQHRVGDRYRVIVCHANIIRWFVCKALGVDPDGTWGRMRYTHCGITAMEVDSVGNVQLSFMNQTGHMGTTMLTEN